MKLKVLLTLKSKNVKTGPMPTSITEATTCPDACPLKKKGCYAAYGPLSWHWRKVKAKGLTWKRFLLAISKLPDKTLWRHNVAGDLPGENNGIDFGMLAALVESNRGKRGFTYTHKPPQRSGNSEAIVWANSNGFTVNLSGNTLSHADMLKNLGIGPVVTILPNSVDGAVTPTLSTPPETRL